MSSSHSAGASAPSVRRFSPLTVGLALAALVAALFIVWDKSQDVLALVPAAPVPGSGFSDERRVARDEQKEAQKQDPLLPLVVSQAIEGSATKTAAARVAAGFPENTTVVEEQKAKNAPVEEEIRPLIKAALAEMFGPAPDSLKLPAVPEDKAKADAALASFVSPANLTAMRQGGQIYGRYCINCHGDAGAGDGPSARHFVPEPRNFTAGVFKFTSTPSQIKPTLADLEGSIAAGFRDHEKQVSMPSFHNLLNSDEIRAVAKYVIYLSARGETERKLLILGAAPDDPEGKTLADKLGANPQDTAVTILADWAKTESQKEDPSGRPAATAKSISRGRQLYLTSAKCLDCHGVDGQGNGKSFLDRGIYDKYVALQRDSRTLEDIINEDAAVKAKFDALAKATPADKLDDKTRDYYALKAVKDNALNAAIEARHKELTASGEITTPLAEYKTKSIAAWADNLDGWGGPFRPANLTWGYYRGAHVYGTSEADRDHIAKDVYLRIKHGINNAKMPAHYPSLLKTDAEIWDVANYVMALPFHPDLVQVKPAMSDRKREAGAIGMSTVTIFMGLGAVIGLVWAALRDLSERVQETSHSAIDIDEPVGRATDALNV